MSTKEELQAQRNELFDHSENTLARIKELDEQIAEAEKPMLRHGDYGTLRGNNSAKLFSSDCIGGTVQSYGVDGHRGHSNPNIESQLYTVLGNIFDDLAAKTEKLESFTMPKDSYNSAIKVEQSKGLKNCIHIIDPDCRILVTYSQLPEFIANLTKVNNHIKGK